MRSKAALPPLRMRCAEALPLSRHESTSAASANADAELVKMWPWTRSG